VDKSIDNFRQYLRERGFKLTPERQAVLMQVLSFRGHFDVDQLYEKVKKYNRKVSRATVYRLIPHLIDSGVITETLRCQGRISYEKIQGESRHDHIVCLGCGKVIEFRDKKLQFLIDNICKKYDFKPIEHRLGIRGYCKECMEKKEDAGESPGET